MPIDYSFRSSILRYLCPTKSSFFENFWSRHCMWFVVWAPPIKNPGYVYDLGGGPLGHGPPLGRQDSIISIEKYAKLWHAPPPLCNLGKRFEHKNGERRPFFGQKPDQIWVKNFFTGGLHLILGIKTDLVLGWKIFILVFINLKFSDPPFRKSCVRY